MILFFIGVIEMMVVSIWTRLVSKARVMASGIVTVVHILIWYYVLQTVVEDIGNIGFVLLYALGCSIGTMITTAYFRYQSDRAIN